MNIRENTKRVLVAGLLLWNLAVGIGLAVAAWLSSVWMVDDGLAAHLTSWGWIYLGLERAAGGLFASGLLGVLFGAVNRSAFASLFPERPRLSWFLAGIAGWLPALSTIGASVQFVIQKPFM